MNKLLCIITVYLISFYGYAQCPQGQTLCGGVCVDLNSNANHCGTCGNSCPADKVCIGGACSCPPGFVSCGNNCVDISTDVNNCGACGFNCPPGKICVGGVCSTCPSGLVDCSGACVDIQTSAANCGACGNTCPTGYACVGGICTLNASTGISVLNGDPTAIFVYPNPLTNTNMIKIRPSNTSVSTFTAKLYDAKGSLIPTNPEKKGSVGNGLLSIPIPPDLMKGIYFLCIESETFNKVIKIIKD
jgi:hypothetical protein